VKVGSEFATLIVIRGNSASGKSTIATGIRAKGGPGIAIVGQDHLRRVVLKDKDKPGAANIGLIDLVTRYALDHGYITVLEGILYAAHYGEMLTGSATITPAARCSITWMSRSRRPCGGTQPSRRRTSTGAPR
jgi:hypothetical protein